MAPLRAAALIILIFTTLPALAQNPIQIENAKPGTTEWRLSATARNREIEGYASLASVDRGEEIRFYVSTPESTYDIEFFRMGWYRGLGGRRMTLPVRRAGVNQPLPQPDPVTGMVECAWTDPYVFRIPRETNPNVWPSGVYLARLTSGTTRRQTYIIFIVRDDQRSSDALFQTSVTTWQAYNNWGGKSLYHYSSSGGDPARKVSFNRPYSLEAGLGTGQFLNNGGWEYNMLRWVEKQGYDVTYSTNLDTHRDALELRKHKLLLSVGHDEYWTWEMRENVQLARDNGVNLAFFSGNSVYWQARLEPSSRTGEPLRTMVSYKEFVFTEDPLHLDGNPSNDHLISTKWRRFPILRPEASLIGVMYTYNPVDSDIVVAHPLHWVFEGTNLQAGDKLRGLLGYEVDKIDEASSPAGITLLARSPFLKTDGAPDHSDMTIYRAASGALVFAVGTIQWSWGLDDFNAPEGRSSRLSPAAQRITRNVFEGLGARSSSPLKWGDADNDGSVGVPDVFFMINALFAGGAAPAGPADANADGVFTVADVFHMINFLFAGGPAPLP